MKVSENKPHSIHLRLTDRQYDYCQVNAELMGVSVSDFIRMYINSMVVASEKLTDQMLVNASRKAIQLGDLENANNQDNIEHKL